MNWIQEIGWYILNGATTGDWEGEFTYVEAKGSAVIDYVIMNKKMHEKIGKFRIGKRMDSDHMLFEVMVEESKGREKREEERNKTRREKREMGRKSSKNVYRKG